jgi:hypothetical protein
MDREQMQRCLEVVAAHRASGHKGKAWAQAHGVPERSLASWCGHARRWQARLDGVNYASKSQPRGFLAAHLAPDAASLATVSMQTSCGAARLDLPWPLAHTAELVTLVRELGR